MFALTTLAYPAVLLLLCAGAGLLLDRIAGGWLPFALLPAAGAALLIALSQLSTYATPLARSTPYLMLALALGGLLAGAPRVRALALRRGKLAWPLAAPLVVYLLALAPVLASGRATLSSYMALADSAVHMVGADYLLHHGQQYAHLDLSNSYGQFVNAYYNSSYPSGADTLFGGSALLLGLPLIWAFQPFNAFMLACSAGPMWLLARRIGLTQRWAALASTAATVPALVYGYALLGSVKEITALPMILTLGALAVLHRRWLPGSVRGVLPFAVVGAAGFSALGAGFGVWLLVGLAAPAALLAGHLRARRCSAGRALAMIAVAVLAGVVCALPTWTDLSGSLRVTQAIASTANPGNLHRPLLASQALGVWLRGSYKQSPTGAALDLTRVLIGLALALCLVGAFSLLRRRQFVLWTWLALMLVAWLAVAKSATTWVNGKEEMLTSPVLVLLAWAGIAALRGVRRSLISAAVAPLVALALAAGVLASDFTQYRSSNLAPTARYDELASLNARFAGKGPALVTDFDEYALYELRGLDVGGPDFAHPPPALAGTAAGYGQPVDLDLASPQALAAYPLIVTRADPSASPPAGAYRLLWEGRYYEAWGRDPGARPALAHVGLDGPPSAACRTAQSLARLASLHGAGADVLLAAQTPSLVFLSLARSSHPPGWGRQRQGLVMSRAGTLEATFSLPRAGRWQLWLEGQIMPALAVGIDGRKIGSVSGQLSGNSLVPDAIGSLTAQLGSGRHRLSLSRGPLDLGPGSGGSAVLDSVFFAPASLPARTLRQVPVTRWRELCGARLQWLELLSAA
jgi:hypothetical protein